jgi:hypothetical protein
MGGVFIQLFGQVHRWPVGWRYVDSVGQFILATNCDVTIYASTCKIAIPSGRASDARRLRLDSVRVLLFHFM